MPLDAATIQAMSGGFTNWDAKRHDAERALQFQQQSTNIAEQSLHQSQMAQAKLAEYYDTINKAGLLDPDQKKVQAKNDELKSKIKDGILKYNGDVSRYMDSGGLTELHEYQQDLINSPEMERGQSNFYNYNKAKADAAAGLILRHTDGKLFDEHVKDYFNGKLDTINYNGAFERPEGDPQKHFSEVYGNLGKTPQATTPADIYDFWFQAGKGKGRSIEDARQFATSQMNDHIDDVKAGGHEYQFKSEDPLDAQLKMAKINKLNHSGKGGGGGADWLHDVYQNDPNIAPNKSLNNANGATTELFYVGVDRANALSSSHCVEYEKQRKENGYKTDALANPKALIDKYNNKLVALNGSRYDMGGLSPSDIKKFTPTGEYARIRTKDGHYVYGPVYEMTVDQEAIDKNEKVDDPYAQKEYHFSWGIPFTGDRHHLTTKVVLDTKETPQLLIDTEAKTHENQGTSGAKAVSYGLNNGSSDEDLIKVLTEHE